MFRMLVKIPRRLCPRGASSSTAKPPAKEISPATQARNFQTMTHLCLQVEEQVNFLMQQLCLADEDIKLRRLVCQLLQEVLSEVYTGASVVPFGSTVSGVGWKGSDLDVCLLTSQLDDTGVDYSLVVDVLRRFAPGCTNIIPVLTAKCPLIKFTHQPSGLSCDLSVNNRYSEAAIWNYSKKCAKCIVELYKHADFFKNMREVLEKHEQ